MNNPKSRCLEKTRESEHGDINIIGGFNSEVQRGYDASVAAS